MIYFKHIKVQMLWSVTSVKIMQSKWKAFVHYQCSEMNPLIGRKYNWPSISTGSSSLDSTKPWLTEYADARSTDTQGWLFYAILYKGLTWASCGFGYLHSSWNQFPSGYQGTTIHSTLENMSLNYAGPFICRFYFQ